MAITAPRYTLGMDREVGRETAASRGRASLMRKGLRQAKREKDYDKALGFAAGLEREGQAYGMTGSAADTSAISQGRVASRDALANQMRSQLPAMAGRSREENIAAAKSAGTFNATREQFNAANAGKKVMDEAGNISDAPTSTGTTPESSPASTMSTPTETRSREFTPPAAFTAPKMTRKERREMMTPLPKLPQSAATPTAAAPATPTAAKSSTSLPPITLAEAGPATPATTEVSDMFRSEADIMRRKRLPTRSAEELMKASGPFPVPTAAMPKPSVVAAREKGGPVEAGKPYLVGEKGPEIVVPEEDGEVIPNKDLKKKKARKALQAALSKK